MSDRNPEDFKIVDPAEMTIERQPALDRHPGVYFREVIMPQHGLKLAPLARLLQANRANLHEVLAGRKDLSRDMAYRIGALLGDPMADFLISYQLQWDLQQEEPRREELRRLIERIPAPA